MEVKPEAQVIVDQMRSLLGSEKHDVLHPETGAELALFELPAGRQLHSVKKLLDEYRTRPERRLGTAKLTSLESFCQHVNRFKDEHTAIFCNPDSDAPQLVAVLDYHEKTAAGLPRFGGHRSVYDFPLSEEWVAWKDQSEKKMSVGDFAEFLEAHILEVAHPSTLKKDSIAAQVAEHLGIEYATPQRLMQLSKGLAIRVDQQVVDLQNLTTGETQMVFKETHSDENGAPLVFPGGFLVSLPVFKNGAAWLIAAQLRYRKEGGRVSYSYKLYRPDLTLDAAIKGACAKAIEATALPLLYGKPE